MAVEKSPPDPPPPDDPSASQTGHVVPPSEGGSKGVRSTQDSKDSEEFYEFSITVRKYRNLSDYYGMPLPHTLVNDVLNIIRKHYPDAIIYSHITRCEVPVNESGRSRLSKAQLVEQADAVEYPTARGKVAYKFLLQSQHGNVDSLKAKNSQFRRDLPEQVTVENCLDGYPL